MSIADSQQPKAKKIKRIAPKEGYSCAEVTVKFYLDARQCDLLNRVVEDWSKEKPIGEDPWTGAGVLQVLAQIGLAQERRPLP